MKEKNLQTLILSEYLSSIHYLDRIFYILLKLVHQKKESNFLIREFYLEIASYYKKNFFQLAPKILEGEKSETLFFEIKKYLEMIGLFLKLPIEEKELKSTFLPFINIIYKNAHQFHLVCVDFFPHQIELPRVNILKSKEVASIPLFYLDPNDFETSGPCSILFLEDQRQKKYREFLSRAYEAISFKQHIKAIEFLSRALNYMETAEVLSLLGWLNLVLNKNDIAKIYCQRAIKLDPDYGPPYNDLGLILMDEGNLKESLELFNLAKAAPNYQNREYPYINSGRIYMVLKKYKLALSELRMALTLVPYHQTLHNTVEKLMQSIPSDQLCPSEEIN